MHKKLTPNQKYLNIKAFYNVGMKLTMNIDNFSQIYLKEYILSITGATL